MNISLQTVMDPGVTPAPYSALTTTVAMEDDTFTFGNLYTVTVTDETPAAEFLPGFHHHHAADTPLHVPSVHDAGMDVDTNTFLTASPGNLQISDSHGDPIVTIHHDGRVILNANFPLDEAARAFWDTVIRLNPHTDNNTKENHGQI
jgi:hypothetical protein